MKRQTNPDSPLLAAATAVSSLVVECPRATSHSSLWRLIVQRLYEDLRLVIIVLRALRWRSSRCVYEAWGSGVGKHRWLRFAVTQPEAVCTEVKAVRRGALAECMRSCTPRDSTRLHENSNVRSCPGNTRSIGYPPGLPPELPFSDLVYELDPC